MRMIFKNLIYAVLVSLLMVACTSHNEAPRNETEQIKVQFEVNLPDFSMLKSIGLDENTIASLELWVFDKDGHFIENAVASNLSNSGGIYTYEAMVTPAPEGAVIHFVANKSLTNVTSQIGKDEGEVLFSVTGNTNGTTIPMWARKEYASVAENTDLGEVKLIRTMAKFALTVNAAELSDVSYSLYNTYDRGTIAPFNPELISTNPFVIGTPTELPGSVFDNTNAFQSADGNHFFYGYERQNANAQVISCLIIKAKYNNEPTYSYYKIDFVKASDKTQRYNIIRNHFYKITVNEARQRGYDTIEAALTGAAANNLALSEEVQMYPSFSDGLGKLEVDRSYFLFTNNAPSFTFNVKYFPDQTQAVQDNSKITLNVAGNAVSGTPSNNNGEITVNLNQVPTAGILRSDIIIGVQDNPDLKRLVRVEVRNRFDFESFKVNGNIISGDAGTITVNGPQDSELIFELVLPDGFSESLLPIHARFFTENFYPSSANGMVYGRKDGKTFWMLYINPPLPADRKFTVPFKSNKANSAEVIRVESVEQYFRTKTITISN